MRREYLQLAHTFDPIKHGVGGWYVSEKLDGMRAYWDGGVSRGLLCSQVPFANTSKDYRRVTPPRATGLWSRYAKPIAAPDWFLDQCPVNVPLDGELYLGRGRFQELISCVKRYEPGPEWTDIKFIVFDIPSDYEMFKPGKINNPNCKLELADLRDTYNRTQPRPFRAIVETWALGTGSITFANQFKLPMQTNKALDEIDYHLGLVTGAGGEGLMLRNPDSIWTPQRTYDLLKVKKWKDSEGLVVGYTMGKGKLEGLIGSLKISWRSITFELSGFTDAEREVGQFPKGSIVTFKYRELSKDGIPKEARYYRLP